MTKAADKIKAYMLYVQKGLTGSEVSMLIGISESGVRKWITQNGWRAERDLIQKNILAAGHVHNIDVETILNYQKFMKEKHPNLHKKIRETITEYLQLKA